MNLKLITTLEFAAQSFFSFFCMRDTRCQTLKKCTTQSLCSKTKGFILIFHHLLISQPHPAQKYNDSVLIMSQDLTCTFDCLQTIACYNRHHYLSTKSILIFGRKTLHQQNLL